MKTCAPRRPGRPVPFRADSTQRSCSAKATSQSQSNNHRVAAFVLAAGAAALLAGPPAVAELNKQEAAAGGEFGVGSAQQYGEADIQGQDFSNQVRASQACAHSRCAAGRMAALLRACWHSRRQSLIRALRMPTVCCAAWPLPQLCYLDRIGATDFHTCTLLLALQDLRRSNFTGADARCVSVDRPQLVRRAVRHKSLATWAPRRILSSPVSCGCALCARLKYIWQCVCQCLHGFATHLCLVCLRA